MNENICKNCDNFMFTYIDEEQKIYNGCKECGNKEEYKEKYIYKTIHNINMFRCDTNKNYLRKLIAKTTKQTYTIHTCSVHSFMQKSEKTNLIFYI